MLGKVDTLRRRPILAKLHPVWRWAYLYLHVRPDSALRVVGTSPQQAIITLPMAAAVPILNVVAVMNLCWVESAVERSSFFGCLPRDEWRRLLVRSLCRYSPVVQHRMKVHEFNSAAGFIMVHHWCAGYRASQYVLQFASVSRAGGQCPMCCCVHVHTYYWASCCPIIPCAAANL